MTVESRSVKVVLSAETAQYIRELQKAGKVGDDAMRQVEKSAMSADQALDQLGGTAGKIGIAAAAGLGAVITTASGFEQAMSNVKAATHETAAGMSELRQAAFDAGADTAFSAREAAGGIEALAKAGLSTQDILDGGLTGSLDLAAAGGLEVADAAEAASGALAQFKLDGDQAAHVADLLAAGAGKAQGDVSDMVMALKQAGTVSAQTGLSLEETVATLSAMAEQSLLGSDAGTSLKTMLAALTPNSQEAADAMAQYNIQAFDAQGNFVGMTALAKSLQDGLSGLTNEQRAMALETIFGSDAVRAASIVYDNGADGIAKWISQVDDAGYAAETAAIKQDNLRGDLEKLGGAFETALIGSGEGAQGGLRTLVQGLTRVVDAYGELPPSAQGAATAILGVSAAAGGGIFVYSKIVQGISDTHEALDALNASGSKAPRVLRGIAAAAAGLTALIVVAEGIKAIQRATDETLPGVEKLTTKLIGISTAGEGFSVSLGKEFDSLGESVDRFVNKTADQRLGDTLQTPFEGLFGEGGGLRQARSEIELLDASLANLTRTQGPDAAADALQRLVDTGQITETQLDDLKDLLGESDFQQYSEAVAAAKNATLEEAAAADEAAAAAERLGKKMGASVPLTKEQAKALQDARKDARDAAGEFVGLGDSLDDSKVSLSDWIAELQDQADALNSFMDNARKASKRGLREGLIADLEAAGPAGALRLRQLANASEDEIARANKAWLNGQKAIDRYVDSVVKVPGSKATTLDLKAVKAIADLIAFRNRLDEATKDRIFTITTQYKTVRSASDALPERGQRKASGGLIVGPGTTTSDSVPILASNKEYVVQAAAVDYYGVDYFDAANAMRLAGGGSTDKKKRKSTLEYDSTPSDAARDRAEAAAEERARRRDEREEKRLQFAEAEREAQEAERQDRAQREAAILEGQNRAWDAAIDAAQAQKDAAKSMVDSVKANMDRLGAAATAGFQSQIFDSSSSTRSGLWVGGSGSDAGGWRDALAGDIAGLRERSSIISQLSGMGLSANALEALLGQANNEQISSLIASGEVGQYASMFAEREALLGSVNAQAGMAGYGQEWTAANAQFTQMNAHLEQLIQVIAGARGISVSEAISAQATAAEVARLMSMGF